MTLSLYGTGISRGIAIGKSSIIGYKESNLYRKKIQLTLIGKEVSRYRRALKQAVNLLESLRDRDSISNNRNIRSIIDSHILMLNDTPFSVDIISTIKEKQCNAEWALLLKRDELAKLFDAMEDDYLQARKDDIYQVVSQILRYLNDKHEKSDLEKPAFKDTIVFAHALSPAEILMLHHKGILGLVTEVGGALSHAAIMTRNLSIPAVFGAQCCLDYVRQAEEIILDIANSTILLNADKQLTKHYHSKIKQINKRSISLNKIKAGPAITLDNRQITILSNIDQWEDVTTTIDAGANGIGLLRTELLFLQQDTTPDEEAQFSYFEKIMKSLHDLPITIRTLDLGSDKTINNHSQPSNPALGLRGIRLCLQNLALFKPHLRAILRASALGKVQIMIPMVSCMQEILQFRYLLEEIKKDLRKNSIAFDENIKIGVMIEVPAAAICVSQFISALDFLSIGTNDLIQYTLAIDRTDDIVNHLYEPMHPAVLKLINNIVRCGHEHQKPVSLCGELANDTFATRFLLGVGLTQFSMQSASILEVKKIIMQSNYQQCKTAANEILKMSTSDKIISAITDLNKR